MFIALDRSFRALRRSAMCCAKPKFIPSSMGKRTIGNTAHSTPPERSIQSNSHPINMTLLRSEQNA